MNGAPGVPDVNPEILKLADIFCINESEVSYYSYIGQVAIRVFHNINDFHPLVKTNSSF